jgi:hypothetical protein
MHCVLILATGCGQSNKEITVSGRIIVEGEPEYEAVDSPLRAKVTKDGEVFDFQLLKNYSKDSGKG